MNKGFSKGSWWGAFLVTLAGVGASLYLTLQHFAILKNGSTGETLCNINPYVNCDSVLMSPYAQIGTIPLAGLGLIFYIYLTGALIYARIEPRKAGQTLTLPYLLILGSVALSLLLAYTSVMIIQALCIFCTSLYVVNILLMFLVKKVMGMNFSEWLSNFKKISWVKNLGYLIILFAVGGILLHTNHKQFAQEIPQDKLDLYMAAFFKQPQKQIDTQGRPFIGNPNAKIVVAEFSDYECPYCKKAANTLKPILSQYKGQVKLVFFNYPLDMSCNSTLERDLHKRACATAYAAYCAQQQGKFWEYHDKAFARQPKFHKASLENIAEKIKLDLNKFNACLESQAPKDFVKSDLEQGKLIGIRGTPAVYVNGRKFQPWMSRKAWKQLITKISGQS